MRRILYSSTLAEHSVGLDALGFINERGEEALGERYMCVWWEDRDGGKKH